MTNLQHIAQLARHEDGFGEINNFLRNHGISGSGFNSGTQIVSATPSKIVLTTSYEYMDNNGHYIGWTAHRITITPSFVYGFSLKISGQNKKDIKDYIAETFEIWLGQELSFVWNYPTNKKI